METDRGQAMIQQGKAHVIHPSHIEFVTVILPLSLRLSSLSLSISLPRNKLIWQINNQFRYSPLGLFKIRRSKLCERLLIWKVDFQEVGEAFGFKRDFRP